MKRERNDCKMKNEFDNFCVVKFRSFLYTLS